jgi:hypothetical protein
VTDVVRGDPASCSQTGGALRRLAADLRIAPRSARVLGSAGSAHPGRPGHALADARRRVDVLDHSTTTLVDHLDRIGSALQAHATDLAEAIVRGRQVEARAQAAGLQVTGGVVAPAWGVTGVADEEATAAREVTIRALQAELDAVLVVLGRRRQRLSATVRESRAVLSASASELRR